MISNKGVTGIPLKSSAWMPGCLWSRRIPKSRRLRTTRIQTQPMGRRAAMIHAGGPGSASWEF